MTDARLTLFYDGDCPLCRREVDWYRRRDRAGRIAWADISGDARPLLGTGLAHRQALSRLYARLPNGRIVGGARAFLAVWRELPGLRLPARVLALPPFVWLLELGYRGFLLVRPWITGRRPCAACGEEDSV